MHIDGEWFKDDEGRSLILRGVNLGGNCKTPFRPDGATWKRDGFLDYKGVSFVGRPFPLAEADEHFRRLKEWGLRFERFLVTWEAIEHEGPGIYDEDYLDYVRAVLEKAEAHGIQVFIDPHQDVWSRWTGGDGAPAWSMELVGMDISRMHEVGAAFVQNLHDGPYPHMVWDSNNYRFGTCTMFTLFFGGNDFAPRRTIDGEPVQEFLQRHYIDAVKRLAERLGGLPNVVGFGSLNEPQCGYIEFADLVTTREYRFIGEAALSPLDSMAAACGYPRDVYRYQLKITGSKRLNRVRVNPEAHRLWKDGYDCVWKEHGVWSDEGGTPRILTHDYFSHVKGRKVSFVRDYLKPFIMRFAREIRMASPRAFIFIEAIPGKEFPPFAPGEVPDIVNASHWYDVLMVYRNKFSPWYCADVYREKLVIGKRRVSRSFKDQMGHIKDFSRDDMCSGPTMIGEFGLMYKLNDRRAYRSGDYRTHVLALSAYYDALDSNLLGGTIWNYAADNNNLHGDNWNEEDNSIFSRDQQQDPTDINSGGRAIGGFCRPYAVRTAGTPLSMSFRIKGKRFVYTFAPDESIPAATEIYVPRYHYPNGFDVKLSSGAFSMNEQEQILTISGAKGDAVKVTITARK